MWVRTREYNVHLSTSQNRIFWILRRRLLKLYLRAPVGRRRTNRSRTGRNERIKTVKLGEDGLSNSNRRSLTSAAVRWPSAKPSRFCTWFKNGTAVQDLDLLTSHNWADFRNFWNFLADEIFGGRLIFEWFQIIF